MDRIFIPTVNRVEQQTTYGLLPDELKRKVTFVVQAWEREKYSYNADYLVLPPELDIHNGDRLCLAKTRKHIYEAGRGIKYAVLDDDLTFQRRNAKYWTGVSNMEKSKRHATTDEIGEMFRTFTSWLDEPDVTVCGCAHSQNPPQYKLFKNNASLASALWINGADFSDILSDLDLVSVAAGEDTYFLLQLLTRGYGNRVSDEFMFTNGSVHKKTMKSDIWDILTDEDVDKDHRYIADKMPGLFSVSYVETGERTEGGFRQKGVTATRWKEAYKIGRGKVSKTRNQQSLFSDDAIITPGANAVTLSNALAQKIKRHFKKDKDNRFELFLLSHAIREKYLDKKSNEYSVDFIDFYEQYKLEEVYGTLANFTKYAAAGSVIEYVKKTRNSEQNLNKLPVGANTLYEISLIIKLDEEALRACWHFTPRRKSKTAKKHEWITSGTKPLIRPDVTVREISAWRKAWEEPEKEKAEQDKYHRNVKLLTLSISEDIFKFDAVGNKEGVVDLEEVLSLLGKVQALLNKDNEKQFRLESQIERIQERYAAAKEKNDPNIVLKRKKQGSKYKND